MAAAATILPFLVIIVLFATRSTWCQRPSYAGSSGGKWESYVGQIIPPGTPWPAKAEESSTTPKSGTKTTSSAGPINVTDLSATDTPWQEKENQTVSLPPNNDFVSTGTTIQEMVTQSYTTLRYQTTGGEAYPSQMNKADEDKVKLNTNANGIKPSIVLEYKPNRPSFAGATGGILESYLEQKESSGTTNISNSSSSTTASPSIVLEYKPNRPSFAGSSGGTWESLVGQRVPESTTTEKETNVVSNSISSTTASPSIVLEYKPNRPSFAGATGGTWESLVGQRVPESTTTEKETKVDSNSSSSTIASPSIVLEYKPNRPSFAGATGGTWESLVGQRVPESTTTEKETKVVSNSISSTTASPSIVLEYKPNRPSFAGATGGTWESLVGQRVPESTTTEKETKVVSNSSSSTTASPSIVLEYKPNRPSFAGATGGTWESLVGQRVPESTTTEKETKVVSNSSSSTTASPSIVLEYKPNRPSFAGATGGTWESLVGQRVPESTTTEKETKVVSNSSSSTTASPSIVLEYKPNRPSFAGATGGTWESLVGQRVPESSTTEKEANVVSNSSSSTTASPSILLEYKPNRPSFAGATGGTWESLVGQRVPESTTTEKETKVDSNSSSSTTASPSIVLEYKPNRPSFAGATGGTWESLVGQSVPESSTTEKEANVVSNSSSSTTASPSILLEYKPNRPSFAGATGGTWESLVGQRVPESTTTEKETKVVSNSSSSTTASPSIVLEYKPNRPSFAGATGGTWESLVGQRVPESTTTEKETNVVSNSISSTIPKRQAIASLISTATTSNHSIIFQPNSPNSERDINENGTIKATEIFLEAEKCKDNSTNKENDSKIHPTLNPILNIEEDSHENKRLLIN